jgi:nucleoside-diphosphate-sugar epimerase
MKIVVTGASGHIGTNLVYALVSQGQNVRALVHVNHGNQEQSHKEVVAGYWTSSR